jgi:hypothetical protein
MNEHGGTSPAAYSGWLNTSDILVSYQPFSRFFFSIFTVYLDDWERERDAVTSEKTFLVLLCCCLYTGQRSASADIPLFFTYCYLTGWLLPFSLGQLTRADQPIYIVVVRWSRRLSRSKKKKRKLTWKRCGPGCCPTSHKCTEALGNNSASRQSRRRDHRIWHGP